MIVIRTVIGSLVALIVLANAGAVVVPAAAHSHIHNQLASGPAYQHQADAGKINSPGLSPLPSRPVRQAHEEIKYIDLSHPLHNSTLHWPTNRGFQVIMDIDSERVDPRGKPYYMRSDSIHMATHAGTHLDAPSHFYKDGWSVAQIPLERLINVPLVVVDVSDKVKTNKTYSFVKDDFMKGDKPIVMPNSVVLVYTGMSEAYDSGYKSYIGTEGNASLAQMKIPGFSLEAAQYLVEQKVYGVGLDAISADSSDRHANESSYDPQAHVAFNSNNIYILENINKNLKKLIGVTKARLAIAPLPIVAGTGSPVRLVAIVGHDGGGEPNGRTGSLSNGVAGDSRSLLLSVLTLIVGFLAITI